jgi:hypothetical protein
MANMSQTNNNHCLLGRYLVEMLDKEKALSSIQLRAWHSPDIRETLMAG